MKRVVLIAFISLLLASLISVQIGNIPCVNASPEIHQEDMVLTGNNLTVIEGRFDINGSIIVEENATLILRNAVVNFTQTEAYQFNMTFRNPAEGNPRLIVENATIIADGYLLTIEFHGNSSASMDKLTASDIIVSSHESSVVSMSDSTVYYVMGYGYSNITVSDSSVDYLCSYEDSNINVFNCTIGILWAEGQKANVSNSVIDWQLFIATYSANCSVNGLQPGFFNQWNFEINCSVKVTPSGAAPNITVTDTRVDGWSFSFREFSNATVQDSELLMMYVYDFAIVSIYDSSLSFGLSCMNNSSTYVYNLTVYGYSGIRTYDNSRLNLSSSVSETILAYDDSSVDVFNCTVKRLKIFDESIGNVSKSRIDEYVVTYAQFANLSIAGLEPGFVNYWNFCLNCSVSVALSGQAPNLTLTDTQVEGWSFGFYEASNVTIFNSELYFLTFYGSTSASIYDSTISAEITSFSSSKIWLVNSTTTNYHFYGQSKVYVCWYLDVHVIDSIGQNVPFANVTATYPNATVAESRLTDTDGWARLTLMEKMMNNTGSYPVGNYTVEATYETYLDDTTVNMTGNKQITLGLPFIIPEFPSILIVLPLFMIVTLIAVIAYRRKYYLK